LENEDKKTNAVQKRKTSLKKELEVKIKGGKNYIRIYNNMYPAIPARTAPYEAFWRFAIPSK